MESILDKFQNLGRYKDDAPHKPLLILALLDWIEYLSLDENRIPIDTGLFERFDYYWDKLYDPTKTKKIHYPIRYLQTDDLGWQVIVDGNILKEEKSKSYLKAHNAIASFDNAVWYFLQTIENRDLVRLAILNTYFPGKKEVVFNARSSSLAAFEAEFFEEPQADYRTKNHVHSGFVRDNYFRLALLEKYDNTCAVSGMQVFPPGRIIQACHILQFSETGNNSIRNGIALCANLHAAFDKGYIGINEKYEVLVNESSFEEKPGIYGIQQLQGKKLQLPQNKLFWPSKQHLKKHRNLHFT